MKINEPGITAGTPVGVNTRERLRMECLRLALQAAALSSTFGIVKSGAEQPDVVGIAQKFERYATGNATSREAD